MNGSALLGHPPNNEHDALIIKGYWKIAAADQHGNLPPTINTSIIPIMTPPNAPHDSHQSSAIASPIVVIILTIIITGTRLLLRIFRRELRWGSDDWAILVGALGVVTFYGTQLALPLDGGAGKHIYDLTYEEYNSFLKIIGIGQTLFYPVLGMIKISITLFNRRLTGLTSRAWLIYHNVFLGLCVAFIISSIFANLFSCLPVVLGVDLARVGGSKSTLRCLPSSVNIVVIFSAIHSAMDFMLLTVPIIILFRMQMDWGKKIRLAFLFSVGFLSCLGSVMRQIVQKAKHPDVTYDWDIFLRWNIVDMFFAVTVASLPTLNLLLNIPLRYLSNRYSSPRGTPPSDKPSDRDPGQEDSDKSLTAQAKEEWEMTLSERTLKGDEESSKRSGSEPRKGKRHPEWERYYPQINVV